MKWLKNALKSQSEVWTVTFRVFGLMWRASPGWIILFFMLQGANALAPTIMLWIGKLTIDRIVEVTQLPTPATNAFILVRDSGLLWLLGLYLVAHVLTRLFSVILELFTPSLMDLVSGRVILLILRKVSSFGELSIFENPKFHDQLANAEREVTGRPANMLMNYGHVLFGFAGLIGLFTLLARIHIAVPSIILLTAFLLTRSQFYFWKQRWSIFWRQTEDTRLMDYYKQVLTSVDFAKEVRLFGLANLFITRWQSLFDRTYQQVQEARIRTSRRIVGYSLFSGLSIGGAYVYASLLALYGEITLGDLAIYIGATSQIEPMLRYFISGIGALYADNLYMSNLFSFLDLEPELPVALATSDPIKPIHARTTNQMSTQTNGNLTQQSKDQAQSGVEIKQLTFTYPGTDRKVLDNLSLQIQPGETIAIVGENGAGKSTLVKLLLRFYDPDSGSIHWSGDDIRTLPLDALRGEISAVFQDFSRYALDVKTNIGLGQLALLDNQEQIQQAAIKSGADTFIADLPLTYHTQLGKQFSDGTDLSGGEWQRIALARAFMRDASAELLILDEPTAALDATTEYELFKRFRELVSDKMALLISHRFSTVRLADRILVMENGTIIEEGSHDQLMALGEKYASYYQMQMDQFLQDGDQVQAK